MKKTTHRSSPVTFGLAVFGFVGLLAASPMACATNIRVGDEVAGDGGVGPIFTSPDAADVAIPPSLKLCIATECPAPYGTCSDGLRCTTNLSNDPNNCGACGVECPGDFGYLNMTSSCVNGTCEPACASRNSMEGLGNSFVLNFADCNGTLEDGCETAISTDTNNCGGCGIQCASGVRCILGKCGCDSGMLDCEGQCIDPRNNDDHCGACGNSCQTPEDAGAPPNHMYFGCVDRQCGQPKCIDAFGTRWADCDNNLANGCEVYVGTNPSLTDLDNCGFCGNKCAPGQRCWDTNLDSVPECGCTQPSETMCGSFDEGTVTCRDLLNDIESCGTCFKTCPVATGNQVSLCRKGVCEVECAPGWGDCDLEPGNGCETYLDNNDAHCGACGNRCDTQAGQPCIAGQCAMTECDAGGPR